MEPITAEQMQDAYREASFGYHFASASKSQKIIMETAREFCVSVEDLKSPLRTREFAWPRQECMLRIREQTTMSLPAIGRLFNRDHTTVMHSIKAATKRRAEQ